MSFTIIRWFNREWYFWDLSINTLFNEMTLCYVVGCNILSVELMPSNFELSFLCSSEIQFWYLITIHIYIYFLSDYLCSLVEQILEKDKNILFTWIYVYQVKLGTKIVGVNSGMNLKKKKKRKKINFWFIPALWFLKYFSLFILTIQKLILWQLNFVGYIFAIFWAVGKLSYRKSQTKHFQLFCLIFTFFFYAFFLNCIFKK